MKYIVYMSEWSGSYFEEIFTSREDAEEYIAKNKYKLSDEEEYFIIKTDTNDWATELVY